MFQTIFSVLQQTSPPAIIPQQSNTSFYPSAIQPIDPTEIPPQAHLSAIHLAQLGLHQMPIYGPPITDVQVAHARLNKQGHRPLGRTQSAPLPLGHPMLTGMSAHGYYENNDAAERQSYGQKHSLLTQKIRQTVLTRSGGSREPQLKEEEDMDEVIDLTDKNRDQKSMITSTSTTSMISKSDCISESKQKDQEYLQQQREILFRQNMQVFHCYFLVCCKFFLPNYIVSF